MTEPKEKTVLERDPNEFAEGPFPYCDICREIVPEGVEWGEDGLRRCSKCKREKNLHH